ncbi:MAG TPA: ATP-binding cassette domain-containing protein, partial [Chloroflexi bacterium]|nr:ATP-binding cassette domain-containing protein [Chloroflexota bacterium]
MTAPGENLLDINALTMLFGGLRAVSSFNMAIPEGGLYGLIGPNGAGKTTVFNMITGIYLPTEGSIQFYDQELVGLSPRDITRAGIARTFQNIRLFQNLTVLDNVRIAYHTHAGYNLLESITRLARFSRQERELTERAQDFLAVFGLQDRQLEMARNLPYGEQRRLEIARA